MGWYHVYICVFIMCTKVRRGVTIYCVPIQRVCILCSMSVITTKLSFWHSYTVAFALCEWFWPYVAYIMWQGRHNFNKFFRSFGFLPFPSKWCYWRSYTLYLHCYEGFWSYVTYMMSKVATISISICSFVGSFRSRFCFTCRCKENSAVCKSYSMSIFN